MKVILRYLVDVQVDGRTEVQSIEGIRKNIQDTIGQAYPTVVTHVGAEVESNEE